MGCPLLRYSHLPTSKEHSPRNATSLHLVGHSDIGGPHIILPALLAQDATQDSARVHPHTHVHPSLGLLPHIPARHTEVLGCSSVRGSLSPPARGILHELPSLQAEGPSTCPGLLLQLSSCNWDQGRPGSTVQIQQPQVSGN